MSKAASSKNSKSGQSPSTDSDIVSLTGNHRPGHVHSETHEEKGKVKHVAQLLPDELENHSDKNDKKREAQDDEAAPFVTPPTKRRRTNATIQRSVSPAKNSKKTIPEPPSSSPPSITKYMKVLLLGPASEGKKEWIQMLNPSTPAADSEKEATSFAVDYHSKDYSFESSSASQETVRLNLYSTDCNENDTPPPSWASSLIPKMQHVVLVLDLFAASDARETLSKWKTWLERHVTKGASRDVPVSLLLVHSKRDADGKKVSASAWYRLGATVDKLCRDWNINKWYMMDHEESASDVILQTMIERTWSAMGASL